MNFTERHSGQSFVWLLAALLVAGCSREPETGPGEVRWDREVCARCVMAVSDRHYSAQVRGGPGGQKTKLYKFDDIGCAVIWLDEQPWKDDPRTEVWVTDHRDGEWIDARRAYYVKGKLTPMDYGLGAQDDPAEGALDYEQAGAHVYQVEERFNIHGGQPHPAPPESK
ncbi:MAG: hypothetical protein U9Q71_10660 [Pseudomonadota bacterium]|nr:hypothetical protein [Pseudomonadota bacterium]